VFLVTRCCGRPDDHPVDWSGARRSVFYRPVKKQLTLRIDADVIDWFKTRAGNSEGYQTRINEALRAYVTEHGKKHAKRLPCRQAAG